MDSNEEDEVCRMDLGVNIIGLGKESLIRGWGNGERKCREKSARLGFRRPGFSPDTNFTVL